MRTWLFRSLRFPCWLISGTINNTFGSNATSPSQYLLYTTYDNKPATAPLLYPLAGHQQPSPSASAPLHPGDTMPPVLLSNILNHTAPSLLRAPAPNRWTLLVFWNTGCYGSVSLLPRLDSLQQQFGNKLLILPVTAQPAATVIRTLGPGLSALRLSFAVSDTTLGRYFPYTMVPQVVWINPHGVVQAITEGWHLTVPNLRKAISQGTIRLPLKHDMIDFHPETFILSGQGKRYKEALLTPYTPGLPSAAYLLSDSAYQQYKILALNNTIRSLFELAFPGLAALPANRLQVHSSLHKAFNGPPPGTDPTGSLYCYQRILPLAQKEKALLRVQQDLQYFFGYTAGWHRQLHTCWVLTRTDTAVRLTTTGSKPAHNLAANGEKYMTNLPLPLLLVYLNHGPIPVLDESGITGRVDLRLNEDLSDIPALNRALAHYGLCLKKTKRPVTVMVINPARETKTFSKPKTINQ